jgi:hypothetical protein
MDSLQDGRIYFHIWQLSGRIGCEFSVVDEAGFDGYAWQDAAYRELDCL